MNGRDFNILTNQFYSSSWIANLEKDIVCNARAGYRHFGFEVPRSDFRKLRKRLFDNFNDIKIDVKHLDKYITTFTIRW